MKTELNENTDHLALSLSQFLSVHRFPLCFVGFVYSLLKKKKKKAFINSSDSSGWKLKALQLHR